MKKGIYITLSVIIIFSLFLFASSLLEKEKEFKKQNFVKNQLQCRKASEQYAKVDPESLAVGNILEKEQYIFDDELNTCLYRKEWVFYWLDGALGSRNYSVVDVYSNKVIVNSFQHFGQNGEVNSSNGEYEEYSRIIREYFHEEI